MKTAQDPSAHSIDPAPKTSSIATLIALTAPVDPPSDARTNGAERATYELRNVRLVRLMHSIDRDVHLTIEDSDGRKMIVESADPACVGESVLLHGITRAREAVRQRFGTFSGTLSPDTAATLRGVAFFDRYIGQWGQARNGIEIHPVTAICFGRDCALPP